MSESLEQLTAEQRRYAHVMFQNRIYRSSGQRFEDFFVAIMTRRDHRFRPVKPQGRIGDQGNDGFIPEEGRYFQVYAPEDPADKVDTAAKKARDDFAKLKKHWDADSRIVDFRFVFNDKYEGTYPTVEHALAELKRLHGLDTAKPFLAKDLEAEFWLLSTADKEAVLEMVIPRSQHISDIDYGAFTEILQHLVDNQQAFSNDGPPTVPDYESKLLFNGIDTAASLLRVGNYQNAAVDLFFDRHGQFTKKDIRDRLAKSYNDAVEKVSEMRIQQERMGDQVFFRLLNDIAPNSGKPTQDAALVLIAYFFEKCDVFQEPNL